MALDAAGLQLDHKTGVLSLEASCIWLLRRCLEFAERQRHLAGHQVAKLIGHITWSCLLRRPALSLINARESFSAHFWTSKRVGMARSHSGIPLDCVVTAASHLQSGQSSPLVYATDASGGARGGYGVLRRKCDSGTVAAAGSCAERCSFSAEEFISARRSVLVENERKTHKAS